MNLELRVRVIFLKTPVSIELKLRNRFTEKPFLNQ